MAEASYTSKIKFSIDDLMSSLAACKTQAEQVDGVLSNIGKRGNLNNFIKQFIAMDDAVKALRKDLDSVKAGLGDKLNNGWMKSFDEIVEKMSQISELSKIVFEGLSGVNLKDKDATKELRSYAEQLNTILKNVGIDKQIDLELFNTKDVQAQFDELIQYAGELNGKLNVALGEIDLSKFGENIKSAGGKVKDDIKTTGSEISVEVQAQIDELKKQKAAYQEALDIFSGKGTRVKTTKKNDVATLTNLVDEFKKAELELSRKEQGSSGYEEAFARKVKAATLLKNTADYVVEHGSEKGSFYVAKIEEYDRAQQFLDEFSEKQKATLEKIKNEYKQKISDINSEIGNLKNINESNDAVVKDNTTSEEKKISLYDELNKRVKEYVQLLSSEDDQNEDKLIELVDEIKEVTRASKEAGNSIEQIFSDLDFGDITGDEALSKICELLNVEIPMAAQKSAKEVKVVTSELQELLNTASWQEVGYSKGSGDAKESMTLFGADKVVSSFSGQEFQVDTDAIVSQLVSNLKENIVMSLHNHPDGMSAFTPSDINSFTKLFYDQGTKINGVIADGVVKTIDFTGISKEMAIKIGESYSKNLQEAAKEFPLMEYNNGEVGLIKDAKEKAEKAGISYEQLIAAFNEKINLALDKAFTDNGLASTVKTYTMEQLPELSAYLEEIQKNGENSVAPIEKLKSLLSTLNPSHTADWDKFKDIFSSFESGEIDATSAWNQSVARIKEIEAQAAEAHKKTTDAINEETQAQEKLNQAETAQSTSLSSQEQAAQLEKEKELMQEIATLQEKLNAVPTNPIEASELESAQKQVQELEEEILRMEGALDSWKSSYYEIQQSLDYSIPMSEVEQNMTSNDVVDEYRAQIETLNSTINQLNAKLATTKTRLTDIQTVDSSSNAGDASLKEVESKIQSYEELCEVVKRYNELVLKSHSENLTDTENKEIDKINSQFAATKGVLNDPDKYVNYDISMSRMRGFLGEYNTDQLAQYLGIEIPNAASSAGRSIDNLKIKAEDLKTKFLELTQSLDSDLFAGRYDEFSLGKNQAELDKAQQELQELADAGYIAADAMEQVNSAYQNTSNAITASYEGIKNENMFKEDSGSYDRGYEDGYFAAEKRYEQDVNSYIHEINELTKRSESLESQLSQMQSTKDVSATSSQVASESANITTPEIDSANKAKEAFAAATTQKNQFVEANVKVKESAESSAIAIDKEAQKVREASEAFADSVSKKNDFANANKNVKDTEESTKKESKSKKPSSNGYQDSDTYKTLIDANKKLSSAFNKIDTEVFVDKNTELGQLKTRYEELTKEIQELTKSEETLGKVSEEDMQRLSTETKQLMSDFEKYAQAKKEASKQKDSTYGADVLEKIQSKHTSLIDKVDSGGYSNASGIANKLQQYEQAYQRILDLQKKLANIDITSDFGKKTAAEFDDAVKSFNQYGKEIENIIKKSENLQNKIGNVHRAVSEGFDLGDEASRRSELEAFARSFDGLDEKSIQFSDSYSKVVFTIKNGNGEIEKITASFNQAGTAIDASSKNLGKADNKFKSFFDGVKKKTGEIATYFTGANLVYKTVAQIKQGITYVREIDAALTELKKVTDETDETYKRFLQDASKTAGQIGSTVKDFTNATADFARLGYNIEQASDLAKAASVYYNVGDDLADIGEASDSIISTMHGFGIEAENAMNIVDKFNEVGNNFAISSSGIGQALLRSASALSEAGNTIDESIGLITAANSVVQNPESVGTAMKTLSLRIRGAKVELEDAGEDVDGMANSVSELQNKLLSLTGGKVNIMLDENTFKNTTEILREMSTVWDDMTDVNRAAALELLGGKRQANVLAAVIKNFKTVEDVIQTSSNSAGSALKENAKYMDSIQGRVDRFTNSLQTMWMNALNSDAVKFIVDVGNGLINIIDKLGLINTLAGAIAAKFAFSNKSKFGNLFTGNLSDVPSQISEKISGSKLFSKLFNKSDISQFVSTAKEAANSVEMVGGYAVEADGQLSMFTQSTNAQSAASAVAAAKNTANAISEREVGAAATTASVGVKILNAALGFGIGLLASIAVTGIIKGIDSIVHHAEHLKTEVQDLTSKYQEAKKEFSENLESLSSLTDTGNLSDLESEFASLTKGVNENGENVSLTSDQYERYKAICEQIVGIQPSIAQGYDSATEAIGNNASALENLIELQKAEARLNAKEFVSDDNLSKILEDNKNTLNEAMDEEKDVLSDAKKKRDEIVADIMQDITSNYGDVFDDSVYNSEQWLEIANEIGKGSTNGEGFLNALKNALDSGNYSEEVKNVFRVAISDVEAAMLEYSTAAESASKKVEDAKNGMIDTLLQVPASMDEYDKLSSSGKSFITEWIKNSDAFKIDAKTSESAVLKMKQSIKDMVYKLDDEVEISLQDGTKATLTGQDILDRIVEIDPSSVNYGEYKAKINELLGYLFQALGITDEKTQNQIKVSLGVDYEVEDENGESKNDNLSEEIARVTGKSITEAQSWLDSQPAATVNALYEVKWSEVDGGSLTDVDLLAKANGIQVEDLQDSTKLYSNNESAINGIKNSISEYEEALNKLDEGSFTLEDFNKLIAQYPDLAKGVDKSSKSFRGLRTNLKNAIKASPKSLIKSLKSLSEQLGAVGGDTTAIDQLIKQVEAIPNDTIDALSDSYITLEDSIQKAKDAQDELNSAMSEDTNTGYTTRAGAMDEMKELMGKGAIGSESKLWNIADEFGFSYDYSKTIEDNADALAAFIAQRQRWYELGEDNDSYSYDGMSAFATDMSSIADQLGIIWEYQDGLLNFDFNGKTFDEIASGMTAQGISMTTEELVDLMTQLGQFHMINWETPDDLVAYFNAIKEGSMTASDQLTQMKSSIETMLKNKGFEVDWSDIDSDGLRQLMYQAGYTGDAVEALISKYQELKKEAEDPLEIGFKTSDDAQTVVDKLETINELKDKITKSENGTIFVDVDGLREALKTAGYTEDAIDELIAKIEEYNAVVKIKPEDGDPMGIKSIISDVNALSQYLPTLGMDIQSVLGADGSYHLTISVDDVIATLNEHGYTAENIQSIIAGLSTNTGITLIGDATIDTAGVQKKIDEINAEEPSPTVSPTVDQTSYNSTEESLNYLARDRSSTVKVTYKETNSNPAESSGTVKWWNPLTWFADGTAHIRGTAHAYGTADAHGDWGATKSETALTGELGPEIIVRGNKWFTVGDHGAEFTDIQKGDIIFNHKQSESLMKNGYVNSRGKSYASGTAFSAGGGKYRSYSFDGEYGYSSSYDISNTVSDVANSISETVEEVADDTEDKTKQTIDFIEYKLEEIETYITNVTNKLGNLLDDTSQTASKNNFYNDLVSAEKDRADTYLKAAALYNEKATDLLSNVPSEYQAMAKNGAIAVKDFIGENETEIADAIEEYRTWAKKADDSENGYLESIAEISAKRLEQLQDIADDFENIVGLTERQSGILQGEMDLLEESGERLSENFYKELMKDSQKQISDLNKKRASLQDILNQAVKSGDVQVGSDDWYEMVNTIYDVDDAILECKKDVEGFQNSINDLYWDNLDKLIDKIDNVDSELSHLYNLVSDEEKVVDEFGNWTKDGVTALGLLAQQLEVANFKVEQYGEAIARLEKDYAAGLYSTDEYNEKLAELKENQWDAIEAQESAKKSIVDLNKTRIQAVKDGMQKEIDAYSELIDKKKEELSLQKEAHDFSKQVAEQQKNIADIEKRLAVIAGDNSASAIAQKKKLQAELAQAKEELEELYYNHSVEKQQDALDKQLEDYQNNKQDEMDALDESLKNEDQIIQDSYATIAANTESLAQNLSDIADKYGITLSDSVTKPWLDGADAIGTYQGQLDTSMSAFTEQLKLLKQELIDLQVEADKTANSIINATNSKKDKTESARYTPPVPAQQPSPSPAPAPAIPEPPSNGSSVTVKSSATHFSRNGGNGTRMQSWVPGSTFTVYQVSGSDVLIGRNGGYTGWVKLSDIEGYAKGSKSIDKDQFAFLDELGEELQLVPDGAGRLSYVRKGTSIIPADISERLMEWGQLDPSSVLEQSRPTVSAPHIINNNIELNMSVGEVVHIDRADNSSIPNITKAVQDQMDNYMKNINKKLYNRVR